MRFPESRMSLEAALPWSDSVHTWLGHQLELRGIDSIIYTRYVITLLQQDVSELEHSEREDLWERRVEAKRNRDRKDGKKKGFSVVSEEDKRKTAAVECLLSVSDEETDIENLVDELCARLKETRCEREYFAPLSINIHDTPDDKTEIKIAESQDPAERYYAAFPALPGEGSPLPVSPSLDEDNVWRRNPFTGTLAGDTYESKDKTPNEDAKKSTPVHEKCSHSNNKVVITCTKQDEKENYHPQPKCRNQSKASPGGNKLKQNAKKAGFEGKNRKGAHLLSWPLAAQDSIANESPSYVDSKEEEYCNMVENMLKELLLGEKEKHHFSRMEKYFPSLNYKYSSIPEWYEEDIYNSEFLENDDWYTKPLENIFATPVSKARRLYKRHSYPPVVFPCSERLNWEDLFPDPVLYLEKPRVMFQCITPESNSEEKESNTTKPVNTETECAASEVQDTHINPTQLPEACQEELVEVAQSEGNMLTSTVQKYSPVCVLSDDETNTSDNVVDVDVSESDARTPGKLSLFNETTESEMAALDGLLKSIEKHWDTFAISNDASSTVSSSDKGCFSDSTEISSCITDVSQQASPFPDMLLLLKYGEDSRSEAGVDLNNTDDNPFSTLINMQNLFDGDSQSEPGVDFENSDDDKFANLINMQNLFEEDSHSEPGVDLSNSDDKKNSTLVDMQNLFHGDSGSEPGVDLNNVDDNRFSSLINMQNVFHLNMGVTDFESSFLEDVQWVNIPSETELGKEWRPFEVHSGSLSDVFEDADGSGEDIVGIKDTLGSCQEEDIQLDNILPGTVSGMELFPFNMRTYNFSEDVSGEVFVGIKDMLHVDSCQDKVSPHLDGGCIVSFNLGSDDEETLADKGPILEELSSTFSNTDEREDEIDESACFPTDLLSSFGSVGDCSGSSDCLLFGLPQLVDTSYLLDLFGWGEAGPRVSRSPSFLFHLNPINEGGSSCWHNRVFLDEFECSLSFEEFCKSSPRMFWDDLLKNEMQHVEYKAPGRQNVKPLYHLWDVNSTKKVTQMSDTNNVWDSIFSVCVLAPEFTVGAEVASHNYANPDTDETVDVPTLAIEDSVLDLQFLEELNENKCYIYDRSISEGNLQRFLHSSWTCESFDPSFSSSYGFVPSKDSAFMGVVPKTFHHVQSAPNLTFRTLLSPLLGDNFEKPRQPPNSPIEHLYFSAKTHFRPIQTPVGTPDAEYQPNDLFGGAAVSTDTPYQQYREVADEEELKFRPKFKIQKYLDKYIQTGSSLDESNGTGSEKVATPIATEKHSLSEDKANPEEIVDLPDVTQEHVNVAIDKQKSEEGSVSSFLGEPENAVFEKSETDYKLTASVPPGFTKLAVSESYAATDFETVKLQTDSNNLMENNGIIFQSAIEGPILNWMDDLTYSSDSNEKTQPSQWISITKSDTDLLSQREAEKDCDGIKNLSLWDYPQPSNSESLWIPLQSDGENSADDVKTKPVLHWPSPVDPGDSPEAGSIWDVPSSDTETEAAVCCVPLLAWPCQVESEYEGNIESIWKPPGSCCSPDHLIWDSRLGQDDGPVISPSSVWAVREPSSVSSVETTALKDIWGSDSNTAVKGTLDDEDYLPLTAKYGGEHTWSAGYEKVHSHKTNEQSIFFMSPEREESPSKKCYQSDVEQSNRYYTEPECINPAENVCDVSEFSEDGKADNIKSRDSDDLYNYYIQNYPEMESFVLSSDLEECTEQQDYDFGSLVPIPQQAVFSSDLEKQWLERKSRAVIDNRRRSHKHRIFKGASRKPCSFFLDGNCRRSDCKFSHDISNITCRFWEVGQCFKGSLCPFLHAYPSNSEVSSSSLDMQSEIAKGQFPELERSVKPLVRPLQSQKMMRKRQAHKEFLKKELTNRKQRTSSKHESAAAIGSVH